MGEKARRAVSSIAGMVMVLAVSASPAQSPDWQLQTSFSHITSMDSSSSSGVWASTRGGVFHLDIETLDFDQLFDYPSDLPDHRCTSLLYDVQGRLWVGTEQSGVAMLDGGEWEVFTSYEGLPGSGLIHCLFEAGGTVWAGTDAGMGKWQDEAFVPLDESTTGGAFQADDVTGLAELNGYLWIASDRGIYSLDLSTSPFIPSSWTDYGALTDSLEIEGLESWNGILYGYGGTGVLQADSVGRWNRIWDDTNVSDMLGTEQHGLIAAARGVFGYSEPDSSWQEVGQEYPEGLTGVFYSSCLLEVGQTLFCGIGADDPAVNDWGLGLASLASIGDTWQLMEIPGPPASNCYQIRLEADGRIYLGSHLRGLMAMFPGEGWCQWGFDEGLPNPLRNYSCVSDGENGYWTASYHHGLTWVGGAGTFDSSDDSVIVFLTDSLSWPPGLTQVICPLLNMQVNMLARQGDVLWIPQEAFWSTPSEPSGLVAVQGVPPDPSSLTWVSREPESGGMYYKDVKMVLPAGPDTLWLAYKSEQGCQILVHNGTPMDTADDVWIPAGSPFTSEDGLPSNQVYCFARAEDGTIYVGTGAGLCRFEPFAGGGGFSSVSGIAGTVKTLAIDRYGRIWCVGSSGVSVVDGDDVTVYDESNSPYFPSTRSEWEFSEYDPIAGTLYISSASGLWIVETGSGIYEGSDAFFYPQPFIPARDALLRLCGLESGYPVTVDFFTLDCSYAGTVEAASVEDWVWDGSFDGGEAATGIYVVIVRHGDQAPIPAKIAIIR